MTACLKLEGISPLLVVIPIQIRSCLTACMTARALARFHAPVLTACLAAITASSLRCPGRVSRVAKPHHSTPTAGYHRSSPTDDEFHASIRPLGSSPNCMSLAFFPLNRLRFSGSLHHSPSIQLHLQHDSMVDDQSTLASRRLQAHMCTPS